MATNKSFLDRMQDIRTPQADTKIYKDECVLCFDTPESDPGLYVCLKSFLGFGREYVESYHRHSGHSVFLLIHRVKTEIPVEKPGDGPDKKITRLAIGVEGGFDPESERKKYDIAEECCLVVLPSFERVELSDPALPDNVVRCVEEVLKQQSAGRLAELEALASTWDGEKRAISKHAHDLLQLDPGRRIPPSGWKCEECDLTTNLWLNLTDGSILCGRKFYDGSGGNDHAIQHYNITHHPLAVKLGTITNEGKADVYSYDEDDMVDDPNLVQHLAHFGINIANMEKTDKSMVELELDLNQHYGEWFSLQESGSQLVPVYGAGHTGLVNLGNSCYLNSVMQVLFSVRDFRRRYADEAGAIFSAWSSNPAEDFNTQMAKLGTGLLSGKYSPRPAEGVSVDQSQPGISPLMFKTLVGRGHPDFASKKQQDAQEFLLHVLNLVERHGHQHGRDPSNCFKFLVEDRIQCLGSLKVKYTSRSEALLALPIPLEAAINKEEVATYELAKSQVGVKLEHVVRPRIPLFSCVEALIRPETVEQFYSTALNEKTTARKTTRLATFPDYLWLHLKKFTLREDWVPVKLDVAVDMPDELDLTPLRATGQQPSEEALPELVGAAPEPEIDQAVLAQLADMGFPVESCKRALYFTQNQGLEAATDWVMSHIADADFADPFIPPGTEQASSFTVDEEAIATISSMGFTRAQATKALRATNNNVERAADWIFTHQSELDAPDEPANQQPAFTDGSGKYRLVAFISHMGTSTMVGHYVCHILRNDKWLIFNDNKVALSENPPKDLGYLFLYERLY